MCWAIGCVNFLVEMWFQSKVKLILYHITKIDSFWFKEIHFWDARVLQLQQKRKGSQANILESFQITTERGCLETASLQLWHLQNYEQRKSQMETDTFPSRKKPTVLLSEHWEKFYKELTLYSALLTLPSQTFHLTHPLLPQQDASLYLSLDGHLLPIWWCPFL